MNLIRLSCLMALSFAPARGNAAQSETDRLFKTISVAACTSWIDGRSIKGPSAFNAISENLACYDGKIERGAGQELVRWLSNRMQMHPALVVRSQGGPVDESLPIGRAILSSGATVFAFDLCASSCANYMFGLGNRRIILPQSLVLFHGGVSVSLIEEASRAVEKQLSSIQRDPNIASRNMANIGRELRAQLREQRRLMKLAGVDPRFFERFDRIDPTLINDDRCTPGAGRTAVFLTSQQFRKIGMPVSGDIVSSTHQASAILERIGAGAGKSVCLAPDALIRN